MTIKIKIGDDTPEKKPVQAQVSLQISKTLDGNILINDHEYMDIVIDPKENKIITLPKPFADKDTYSYQSDLYNYLFSKGLLVGTQVEGGPTFGMMEAPYPPTDKVDVDPLQSILFQIEKYIQLQAADNKKAVDYDENIEDRFVDPPEGEYTPYGKIPPYQDTPAGSQDTFDQTFAYAGYGYLY
jgi:hypothetical protein